MAAKKKTPASTRTLFKLTDRGKCADGKACMFQGHVGGYDIGVVTARNKTEGKKKLLRIARGMLR